MPANPYAERNRPEVARLRGSQQIIDSLARQRHQLFAGIAREPSGECQRLFTLPELLLQVLATPGTSYDVPAIAGRRGGVNDNSRRRAPAERLLVLIGPAPEVGKRAALEELGIGRRRLVGEQDQHFPAHVDTFEVVPVPFRRRDAMTDKDGVQVESRVGLLLVACADELGEPFKRHPPVSGCRRKLSPGRRFHADQRYSLKVASVFAGRLCSGQRELVDRKSTRLNSS